jgi:hypothetical protein
MRLQQSDLIREKNLESSFPSNYFANDFLTPDNRLLYQLLRQFVLLSRGNLQQ